MKKKSSFLKKNSSNIGFSLIILLALFFKMLVVGQGIKNGIQLNNTLDFSWQLDIVERFLHGYVAGRDFIFTYGPLYQFITSIPSILFGIPSFISIIYAQLLLLLIACLLLVYVIRQIVTDKIDQLILFASTLFIVNLISFPTTSDVIRILFPFFYAFIYSKYTSPDKLFHFRTIIILTIPSLFGLYTFDNFFLFVLITICLIAYRLWQVKTKRKISAIKRYVFIGLWHLVVIFIFELLVSFALTQNLNYLLYSLDTVKNYQYILSIPLSLNRSMLLLLFPLGLVITYFYLLKNKTKNIPNFGVLTILMITAILQIKSGIIRADDGHIALATYPSALVLFWLLFQIAKEKKIVLLFLIILYILLPGKIDFYESISKQYFKAFLTLNQRKDFFDIYALPENFYYSKKDLIYIRSIIRNNRQNVMVYPYDNYILNTESTTFNAFPLLWYQYSNSLVEKTAVEKLQVKPPKFIILGVDKVSVISLDDIPTFTRNPLLTKWMLKNYSVEKNTGRFLVLKYTPNKKASIKHNTCSIYEVNISKSIKHRFFESFGKPSTYYLSSDHTIRLPYSPDMKDIVIVNDYSNIKELQKLFERQFDFDKYTMQEKDFTIIRKNPFSFTSTTHAKFPIKCY